MAEIQLGEWRAPDGRTERVAVKRLLPELQDDSDLLELFMRELSLTAGLQHPNLVGTRAVTEVEDRPALVMELVEGEDLRRLLRGLTQRGERLPPELGAHIALELASGLQAAHAHQAPRSAWTGVVHCDLSPANVLVGRDGSVKLADFGIARRVHEPPPERTFSCKAGYVSPEQIRRAPVDGRTDLFLLGVLLYELLTGERLFRTDTLAASLRQVLAFRPEQLNRPDEVPPCMWEPLLQLLQPDPARRPAGAFEAGAALRSALAHLPGHRGMGAFGLAALFARAFPGWAPPQGQEEEPLIDGQPLEEDLPTRPRLGELLVRQGKVSPEQLELALQLQLLAPGRLGQQLLEQGTVGDVTLVQALAEQRGVAWLEPEVLGAIDPPEGLLARLPRTWAECLDALPVAQDGSALLFAMADPESEQALAALRFVAGCPEVRGVLAPPLALRLARERLYARVGRSAPASHG